jgi:hypothetical protein
MSWFKPGDPVESFEDAGRATRWVRETITGGSVAATGGGIHSDYTRIMVGDARIVFEPPEYWSASFPELEPEPSSELADALLPDDLELGSEGA